LLQFCFNFAFNYNLRPYAKDSPPPTPRIRGSASSSPNDGSPRLPGASSPRNAATAGWASVVVLYTTSMSTVRKTAGQCSRVRQVLVNLGVDFLERDISMAGRCRLKSVEARVEIAWFQRLKLRHDNMLSNFAFDCSVRRYTMAVAYKVGRCGLTDETHVKSAWN